MLKLKNYRIVYENKIIEFGDINIKKNEFVGLCGDSGCGKTSFLNSLFRSSFKGKVECEQGEINGVSLKSVENIYSYLSYCPQFAQDAFNPKLTVFEHIELVKKSNDSCLSDEEIRNYMKELNLSLLLLDSYAYMLSGGQKQRLIMLLGLIKKPSVFVLDEPSSAVDLINMKIIANLLLKLKGSMTIILVSHNRSFLDKICDRVIEF